MDLLKHLGTIEELILASSLVLLSIAVVIRLLERLAKITPTPNDDKVLDTVADALEGAAEDVKKLKIK